MVHSIPQLQYCTAAVLLRCVLGPARTKCICPEPGGTTDYNSVRIVFTMEW